MIKKRNLDPSLVSWIMAETGLGPGIGNIFFVSGATSQYRQKLVDDGNVAEGNMFTLPSAAEVPCVAARNDVVLVMPGAYAETAETAWDKANTHMIGLGGRNIGGDYSEPNVVWHTQTAAVAQVATVTGQNSMFKNMVIENSANDSGNSAAMTLNIYGCNFDNVAFHGNMQSKQNDKDTCASLKIGAAGMYPHFRDCIIGQNVWGARAAANSGALWFASGGRPNGGKFTNCEFLTVGTTATVALVAIPAATSTGRSWTFKNCVFEHFDGNAAGGTINQAFYIVSGAVQMNTILLHHCSAFGIDEWQDGDETVVLSTSGVATVGGGLAIEPTATVS
jgi:hypothetical protein